MNFEEILDQVIALLQRRGRVSYRTLKLQFRLDDEALEALKEELLEVHQVLKEHLAAEAYTQLECRCSPYHQHTLLYPVIDFSGRGRHRP